MGVDHVVTYILLLLLHTSKSMPLIQMPP